MSYQHCRGTQGRSIEPSRLPRLAESLAFAGYVTSRDEFLSCTHHFEPIHIAYWPTSPSSNLYQSKFAPTIAWNLRLQKKDKSIRRKKNTRRSQASFALLYPIRSRTFPHIIHLLPGTVNMILSSACRHVVFQSRDGGNS